MAALTAERRLREEAWSYQTFKLPTGLTAYKGGIAMYDPVQGKCIPAVTGAGQNDLFPLGTFYQTVANSSGADMDVIVRLKREIRILWFKNDGANPVTVNDLGKDCFAVDDQSVSNSNAGGTRSVLGKAWALDTTLGVAVEVI